MTRLPFVPVPVPGFSTPIRVVSLVPSLTETLFDLGAGDSVVGITDFCIFPEDLQLPRVGGTKNPHIEDIRTLKPDLVYMNYEENLRKHADAISEFARVHVSEPKSVDDVAALIAELGELHGQRERAAELVRELENEREQMKKKHFTFACAIWKKPWMWCGGDTYVSSLVECAGGVNVLREEKRYPAVDIQNIEADVVFLPDEPYAFTRDDAAAIPNAIGPFPGHLFTWHGTRTILGLRFLRDVI
ncbi:MAG TPA: helical backbone metal receptor [Thermoanaerobaculia bacterium]|nr:helical backbone metal receptor [Thermoanaerobaculia bacterium]